MAGNPLRDAALHYAARGWHVFPLSPRSKKPLPGSRGLLEATTDENQVEQWWAATPDANVGIATGPSGLVVLDPDGPDGLTELSRLIDAHGPLPRTLVSRTANGFHLVYRGSGVRSTARGSLHVRATGGYIVAAPSVHPSGHVYAWVDRLAVVADLPSWVVAWREALGGGPGDQLDLGVAPSFLTDGQLPARQIHTTEPWSPHDEARVRAALQVVPADNYEVWCRVGMACHSLGWDRSDGTSIGRDIWDAWAQTCGEKYSDHAQENHWGSFRRSGIRIGSIFHLAQQHGWTGQVVSQVKPINPFQSPQEREVMQDRGLRESPQRSNDKTEPTDHPVGGPFAAPAVSAIDSGPNFIDRNRAGLPTPTCRNARTAIEALGLRCRFDTFHRRMAVSGHILQSYAGELSDPAVHVIRVTIDHEYGFDPGKEAVRDACEQLCLAHPHDPVVDYLEATEWDGRPRAGRWMTSYLGAEDTALTRAAGLLFLRAAVRRARQPGCKWDHVVVLEGPEDSGKSLALQTLAGEDNFSDQSILGRTDERQQEALEGVWIYELAELNGMRRAEVEHVKSFVSRTRDRARPAYGHYREDRPRRNVFAGTTNDDSYLKAETGNRRFWPIRIGRIELEALGRDRDQLWAEAVTIEDRLNGALVLPTELRAGAREEQEARVDVDPWVEAVRPWLTKLADEAQARPSVSPAEVMRDCLHLVAREQDRVAALRVGHVLRRLGWEKYRQRDAGRLEWRYRPS